MATHQPAEVRRVQILEAALHCLGEKGLHAAKIDDIADRSGLSKGAIYWHFKSKDDIFLALFDLFDAAIFAEWDQIESGDALRTLERFGDVVFSRVLAAPAQLDAWTEFFCHPEARSRMAGVYVRSRQRIAAIVERGVASGELRSCAPLQVAAVLTGMVEGLLLQALVDRDFDPRAAWPQAVELLMSGLAAPDSDSASVSR